MNTGHVGERMGFSSTKLDSIRRVVYRKGNKRCPSCNMVLADGVEMGKACCLFAKKPIKRQLALV